MNPFNNLSSAGTEAVADSLGGGFGAIDSDAYKATVKAFYAGKSDGGAHSMTLVADVEVGGQKREYRETFWVTNKKGENAYEKNGKKYLLPGYITANDIALLTTGQELGQQNFEEKIIKVYNFDQRAEVPTKVMAAVDVMGKEVTLGILRKTVNKQAKDAGGNYVDINEKRDVNEVDKVFHTESGRTVNEVTRGLATGEFLPMWAEKNKGNTINRFKEVQGSGTGLPGAAAGAPPAAKPTNLFG